MSNAFNYSDCAIIQAQALRDWQAGTLRNDSDWVSPYRADVYSSAQRGESRHPLTDIIESALCEAIPEALALTMINSPTGCAPDVAAYCAGEPDSMLDFDSRPQAAPIDVWVNIAANVNIEAATVARHLSAIFAACFALGKNCPVTIRPFYGVFSKLTRLQAYKDKGIICALPAIDSGSCIDSGLLALLSDPRTLRELCIKTVYKAANCEGDGLPAANIKFSDCVAFEALYSPAKTQTAESAIAHILSNSNAKY